MALTTAARALGISPEEAARLAERGEFPCQVIGTGPGYRVPFAALLRVIDSRPARERGDRLRTIWTPEAIRALGPTTDVATLSSIFGCSLWKAYEMARTGKWESVGVKVVRVGRKYRVIVPSILEVFGYPKATGKDRNGSRA